MTNIARVMILAVAGVPVVGACAAPRLRSPHQDRTAQQAPAASADWDDGLCEISYYRAADRIYNEDRTYTRIHLVNRQWMDRDAGLKTTPDSKGAIEVFKLNIAEQIPTQNYNYRYLTTVFVTRPDLDPVKMVVSSQEWCGTTFKHLRWADGGLSVQCFSYFGGEGDKVWHLTDQAIPFEAIFLIVRDVAATREDRTLMLLPPMRSTHEVQPVPIAATLMVGSAHTVTVPAGRFDAVRVTLEWGGASAHFDVEAVRPYRLLAYQVGDLSGRLEHVERRAYWDRNWGSTHYQPGHAP